MDFFLLRRSAADRVAATRAQASQAVSARCHSNQNFCPLSGSDTHLQIRRAPRSATTWVDVIQCSYKYIYINVRNGLKYTIINPTWHDKTWQEISESIDWKTSGWPAPPCAFRVTHTIWVGSRKICMLLSCKTVRIEDSIKRVHSIWWRCNTEYQPMYVMQGTKSLTVYCQPQLNKWTYLACGVENICCYS